MNDFLKFTLITDSSEFINPTVAIGINPVVLYTILIIAICVITYTLFIHKKIFKHSKLVPVEIVFGPKSSIKYNIERNEETIFIAHRIYIELITRKATVAIDPDHDVIVEVYDSWYKMFNIIRDEIKNIPGKSFIHNKNTSKLTKLSIEILNRGLRPHLTKHQAKFRKWYSSQIEKPENKTIAPQSIQNNYEEINDLTSDMQAVSGVLEQYSKQLEKIFQDTNI